MGVRMALRATPGNVMSMVLRRAAVLMAAGLVIGSAGAWYLSAGVKIFLFQVEPNDVRVFAAALATLAAAGLIASVVPARRAAAVDPLIALPPRVDLPSGIRLTLDLLEDRMAGSISERPRAAATSNAVARPSTLAP